MERALMRRIIIREARPGMRVARQVTSPADPAHVVVASGAVLTIDEIILMHELGVYDLWTDDAGQAFLDELHHACVTNPAQQRLIEALGRAFQSLTVLGIDPVQHPLFKRQRPTSEETVAQLVHTAPKLPCFTGLAQSDELLQHSAQVAVLSMLLGLQLENYLIDQRRRLNCREARDVVHLALGSLFHDVGETLLPPAQRESKAALSLDPNAPPDWKQHTLLGYQAVRPHLDPPAAAVVLHHHQHFDGTGFASVDGKELQQAGSAIHVFARIALAADLFHHVLLEPEAGMPRPAVHALWRVQQRGLRGRMDPVVLGALLTLVQPFAPGMVVRLNDRRPAVVTRVNERIPCYPEVQVLAERGETGAGGANGQPGERIDLAQRSDVRIVEAGGEEVTASLYGSRQPAASQPLAAA
jgi:HD-GYP domain-containing protein (c-di-GMP phosphodiesterase class II)